jgi:hypothetical protein
MKADLNLDEKALVKAFIENKPMYNAVKKALLFKLIRDINFEEQTSHWIFSLDRALDDVTYGKVVKLLAQAQTELREAIDNLEDCVVEQPEEKVVINEAR